MSQYDAYYCLEVQYKGIMGSLKSIGDQFLVLGFVTKAGLCSSLVARLIGIVGDRS